MIRPSDEVATTVTPGSTPPDTSATTPCTRPSAAARSGEFGQTARIARKAQAIDVRRMAIFRYIGSRGARPQGSFVAQRDQRVDARGAQRGDRAGRQGNRRKDGCRDGVG